MNSLSQLIYDLNLSEAMVMIRLNHEWQTSWATAAEVPDDKCARAVELVMQVLKDNPPYLPRSNGGGR